MNNRLFENTNLTLTSANEFNGKSIMTTHGPLVINYLKRCEEVMNAALNEYIRVCALRVDLRYPCFYSDIGVETNVISKFIASLKSQINVDLKRKDKIGKCNLRFVWAKEQHDSNRPHYHLMLFLNKDIYHTNGDITAHRGNVSSMIKQAWMSALGIEYFTLEGCVHFPAQGRYWINRNDVNYDEQYNECFYRLSYLTKAKTKLYFLNCKSFNSSRK